MVLLRRTSALTRTPFSNSPVRGKDQSGVTADPPCMRWMASVQVSNLSLVSVSNHSVLRERGVP